MRRKPPTRLARISGAVLLAGILASCNSSSTSTTSSTPPTGTLITIVTDVPICNAISANVVVQDLNFTQVQGGAKVPYLNTTSSFAPEIRLNLQQLRDFSTILYTFPVRAGSYREADVSFELAQLAAYDPTLSPPVHSFLPSFTNANAIVPINPPLIITANQANVMVVDFDVLRMLATDVAGNLTGKITPLLNITQLSATSPGGAANPNGFIELDDLWGFVRSVSTTNTTSNASYTGSFQMQFLSPSTADAPEVPVNMTATTSKPVSCVRGSSTTVNTSANAPASFNDAGARCSALWP